MADRKTLMTDLIPALDARQDKAKLVALIRARLEAQGFQLAQVDAARPWGAFFRIVNAQADKFIAAYFAGVNVPTNARQGERSPKILLVAPRQRLSWQYHARRAELWRAVTGPVGVFASATDAQPAQARVLAGGEMIELAQGVRHRLVGLDAWGAVAEIWLHTDAAHPSDEEDIVRVQDDYSRVSPV